MQEHHDPRVRSRTPRRGTHTSPRTPAHRARQKNTHPHRCKRQYARGRPPWQKKPYPAFAQARCPGLELAFCCRFALRPRRPLDLLIGLLSTRGARPVPLATVHPPGEIMSPHLYQIRLYHPPRRKYRSYPSCCAPTLKRLVGDHVLLAPAAASSEFENATLLRTLALRGFRAFAGGSVACAGDCFRSSK